MAKYNIKFQQLVIMATKIHSADKDTVYVNGKLIYKDTNGNWVSKLELTTQEQEAFNNYLNSL